MTDDKIILTEELYQWFAAYYSQNTTWGVFHVTLDDGNWEFRVDMRDIFDEDKTPEIVEKIEIFNKLSPTQRKKLGRKAEDLTASAR